MALILISDDSDAIRLVLRDIVEIGKHTVVGEAIDGADTVEKYLQLKPDLLLLDLDTHRDTHTIYTPHIQTHHTYTSHTDTQHT